MVVFHFDEAVALFQIDVGDFAVLLKELFNVLL